MVQASKLSVTSTASAEQMANTIFGTGIQVNSATFTGAQSASGIFTGGDSFAPGITPADTGVILSTGKATDVTNATGNANQASGKSTSHGLAGDNALSAIAGQPTFDAAIFEATFVPEGNTLTMQVVFSSEEYLEYVNSGFNDSVGIWVNGVQAELTVGDGDISINNINTTSNENLYVDNPASSDPFNTEMDGFTVTMTLKAPVTPDQENTLRIGIADGGDRVYDSNLLIAGGSVQTALIAEGDDVAVTGTNPSDFDILANDLSSQSATLTITMINGNPVVSGQTITLPSGEMITLNSDGTITVVSDGEAGSNTFSYEVTDGAGNTDTGFVTISTTPCFAAGTLITTPMGQRPVETLRPGDLVLTRDNGAQAVRWVGTTLRKVTAKDAPITLHAGAIGPHETLTVSPNHRILLRDTRLELLFETPEIFVAAKHLTQLPNVGVRFDLTEICYVHVLLDRHEIVLSAGVSTESFWPSLDVTRGFSDSDQLALQNALRAAGLSSGRGYGPLARRELRAFEAMAFLTRFAA